MWLDRWYQKKEKKEGETKYDEFFDDLTESHDDVINRWIYVCVQFLVYHSFSKCLILSLCLQVKVRERKREDGRGGEVFV